MFSSTGKDEVAVKEGEGAGARTVPIWVGYGQTGGRVSLRQVELGQRLLILGRRADDMAALLAFAAREAGLNVLVLDLDGSMARQVSGYFEPYDYNCFLYDAFQLYEESPTLHGQLLAAAYTSALGLRAEEEAIMVAALHKLAQGDVRASPVVLFEALATVEGFRGFYVEKLQGRIGGLKFLESAENASLASLLPMGGSLICFSSAKYPQAMEVAAAAFLAKLLVLLAVSKSTPHLVVMNGAHRVFRSQPGVDHSNRLLTELLDSRTTFVLASDEKQFLTRSVLDAFPFKIMSSDAWNEGVEGRWKGNARQPILPNAFVVADGHFGHQRTFIARSFEARTGALRQGPAGPEPAKTPDEGLTLLLLDDVKRYEAPTRASLTEFLSGEYGTEAVQRELDRLHSQGLITLQERDVRAGGPPMLVYVLTDAGRRLLEALAS
jgi:hypothetical protein